MMIFRLLDIFWTRNQHHYPVVPIQYSTVQCIACNIVQYRTYSTSTVKIKKSKIEIKNLKKKSKNVQKLHHFWHFSWSFGTSSEKSPKKSKKSSVRSTVQYSTYQYQNSENQKIENQDQKSQKTSRNFTKPLLTLSLIIWDVFRKKSKKSKKVKKKFGRRESLSYQTFWSFNIVGYWIYDIFWKFFLWKAFFWNSFFLGGRGESVPDRIRVSEK